MKTADPVLSVLKTMKLLETLSAQEEVGVTELAAAVEGNKSTVYRFLNTLAGQGYVRQNPGNEKYSLTLKLFQVGVQALNRLDIHKAALPVMEELAEATSETIHLASMEESQVFYLDKIESPLTLRVAMGSAQGRFAPVHSSAVGKTILSWLPEERRKAMLSRTDWTEQTANTITTEEALLEELEKIRLQGCGYDMEENEPGVRCVAAPVFDSKGEITAAISVSGPSIRMTDDRLEELTALVKTAGRKISSYLGYRK